MLDDAAALVVLSHHEVVAGVALRRTRLVHPVVVQDLELLPDAGLVRQEEQPAPHPDVVLRPGEKKKFTVKLFDTLGRPVVTTRAPTRAW